MFENGLNVSIQGLDSLKYFLMKENGQMNNHILKILEKSNTSLSDRQDKIIEIIKKEGFAPIEDLSKHFEVTPQTIRRDINKLCDIGILTRFHGGAGIASSVKNVDYSARKTMLHTEKQRIAKVLTKHIPNGASIFINIGTTTEEAAIELSSSLSGLRIITNNLNVAMIVSSNETCEVIVAGGMVRHRDKGITGQATVDFIKQFRVDYGIIGVSGIDEDGTLLDYDYHEVQAAKEIITNSRQVFLLADHTKFNRNAMVRIGTLEEIDFLVTDRKPDKKFTDLLDYYGVSLIIADHH